MHVCMYVCVQDMRLNSRWLDLRVPANNAIMRIRSGVLQLFRESLYQQVPSMYVLCMYVCI